MTPMDSGNQEGGERQRKSFLAVLCAEDRRVSGRREGTMVLRVVARVLAGRQHGLSLRRWCQAYLIGKAPTKSGALSVFAEPAVGSSGLRTAESGLLRAP